MSLPRKVRCTVDSVEDHGGRVYTIGLVPQTPIPSFRPGQFLHLTVDPYDPASFWPESRVFSIASSPSDRRRIRICYSVKGRYTTTMERSLRVGAEAWIKLPYGDFIIDDSRDAVLVAGGTGISAFAGFLESLTPTYTRSVTLLYGARTPDLLLFKDMIVSQMGTVLRLEVAFFAESGHSESRERDEGAPRSPRFLPGSIDFDAVWRSLPTNRTFYLSGPPGMLKAFATELRVRGVGANYVRTDAWE